MHWTEKRRKGRVVTDSWLSCQNYFYRIAKCGEHKPQPSYCKWKISSTTDLTMNFDLHLSKCRPNMTFHADAEPPSQISRKSDSFSRNREIKRTTTNKLT